MGESAEYKKVTGVLGNPVSHSLSPIFQNYLIRTHKLNWIYLPFCIDRDGFELFINGMKNVENVLGFNVTIPFKERAFQCCDVLSEEAKKIGAVNTLLFKNRKIYGYNTDVNGIVDSIKRMGLSSLSGKSIVLIGAGGAARAALLALNQLQASKVIIINRSPDRAYLLKELCEKWCSYELHIKELGYINETLLDMKPDLLINSTSLGLKNESLPIDFKKLWKKCRVFDMVYSRENTPLVNEALKNGFLAIDGIYMLVYQGIKSFTLWSGINNVESQKVISYLKKKVRYGKSPCNR